MLELEGVKVATFSKHSDIHVIRCSGAARIRLNFDDIIVVLSLELKQEIAIDVRELESSTG